MSSRNFNDCMLIHNGHLKLKFFYHKNFSMPFVSLAINFAWIHQHTKIYIYIFLTEIGILALIFVQKINFFSTNCFLCRKRFYNFFFCSINVRRLYSKTLYCYFILLFVVWKLFILFLLSLLLDFFYFFSIWWMQKWIF